MFSVLCTYKYGVMFEILTKVILFDQIISLMKTEQKIFEIISRLLWHVLQLNVVIIEH